MQKSEAGELGIEYWMKWQVPVCGLIMVIPATVSMRLINKSRKSNAYQGLKMADLWVPCWRNLNPKWLLLYRALAFVTMAWLLYEMVVFAGFFAFFFYTQWTFTLAMVYFAIGTLISVQGCFMSSDKMNTRTAAKQRLLKNGMEPNGSSSLQKHRSSSGEGDQEAGLLGSLLLVIYQTSAGAAILTDLVFWMILMPMLSATQFELTLVIAGVHSVNAVFLIIDSLLNALPFHWFGFNYFIIWTVAYAAFQWVSHACCTSWWPYPFLELSTPWAPLWYIGIALVHVPCYALYVLLVKAKNSIFSKLFPQAFRRSDEVVSQHSKSG